MNAPTQPKRILQASFAALCVALLLLITVVLPAEYGWDPLGTGKALNLIGLSQEDPPVTHQPGPWQQDKREFQLAPFEAVEFKYRLNADDTLLFRWRSNAPVLFELHAEPDGAAPGYAESFEKSRSDNAAGSYRAPFTGLHGWFWQNRTQQDVMLTLETNGYFEQAKEFRDGREFDYVFNNAQQPAVQ